VLGFECELQIDDVRAIEADHNVALVADYALFSGLQKSLLFHELESVKNACAFESSQKDTTEPSCSYTFDDFKIIEADCFCFFLSEDWLNFQELPLEHFDWLASLEIVVFERIRTPSGFPVGDAAWNEGRVVYVRIGVLSISC